MLSYDVVLCTFNGAKFIAPQIQSIAKQSIKPATVYIFDDCSTDDTVMRLHELCRQWQLNAKIVVNESNVGFVKNFEQAISYACSDVVFLCDQDDIWEESKAESLITYLLCNEHIDLVFSDATIIDENGATLSDSLWRSIHFFPELYDGKGPRKLLRRLLRSNVVTGATVAFRYSCVRASVPFIAGYPHDAWLALLSAIKGRLGFVDMKLTRYRQHQENVLGIDKLRGMNKSKLEKGFEPLFLPRVKAYQQVLSSQSIPVEVEKDFANVLKLLELRHVIHYNFTLYGACKILLPPYIVSYFRFANGAYSLARDLFIIAKQVFNNNESR
ncbi:MAG: hypothetical protein CMF25_05155 [Kangiellaceae bacterium]|nr:hypothetical protein [Kangiellaceae bacterium]